MKSSDIARYYTIALMIAAFFGSKIFAINIGVQLSLYRVLLLLSPLVIISCKKTVFCLNTTRSYTSLLKKWLIYSFFILPLIKDFGGFFRYLFFLVSALITSFMVGRYLVRTKDVQVLLTSFVLVMIYLALIGVNEMLTGVYNFIPDESVAYYDTRSAIDSTIGVRAPISVAGNPNDFGMMMVFAFIATCTLCRIVSSMIIRIALVFAIVFFAFMVMATQSRSQFLSLLIAIVVFSNSYFIKQKKFTKFIIVVLLVLGASSIAGWLVANKDLYLDLITISASGNESDSVRINLILNGLKIFANSLFLGVGIGNIEYHMTTPGLLNTNNVINIHNWWLEILVSSGIYVFVIYLSYYYKQFKFFWWKLKETMHRDQVAYSLSLCGVVSLVVFVLSSMGSSSIFLSEWFWAYFVMLGTFSMGINNINSKI